MEPVVAMKSCWPRVVEFPVSLGWWLLTAIVRLLAVEVGVPVIVLVLVIETLSPGLLVTPSVSLLCTSDRA